MKIPIPLNYLDKLSLFLYKALFYNIKNEFSYTFKLRGNFIYFLELKNINICYFIIY